MENKNNKGFIGLIAVVVGLVVILIGLIATLSIVSATSIDLYEEATIISPADLGTDTEGLDYYYYYGTTCSHCENIKPDVTDFFEDLDENSDFYVMDIFLEENAAVRVAEDEELPAIEDITSLQDMKVEGSPTLYVVEDGVVIGRYVGEKQIPAYLKSVS